MKTAPIPPTISLGDAAPRVWDAVIVGAGPAGASAAIGLAREGLDVLLVDSADFPRGKVCGCCLNASAIASLSALGLPDLVAAFGARPLHTLALTSHGSHGSHASIPLRSGVTLSREKLDAALVTQAVRSGAHFLPGTTAHLEPGDGEQRLIRLRCQTREQMVATKLAIAADGLGGRFLGDEPGSTHYVESGSLMGVGATIDPAPEEFEPGVVYMTCGRGGYVGLARLEDSRLDLAAALDVSYVQEHGGPATVVYEMLGKPLFRSPDDAAALTWRGTPRLSRRRRVGGHRLFVVGDAAIYVEPFTGEGIAWALESGRAVAPLGARAARAWSSALSGEWELTHRRLVSRKQFTCRLITRGLRHPWLTRMAISLLGAAPRLAEPIVRWISAPAAPSPPRQVYNLPTP